MHKNPFIPNPSHNYQQPPLPPGPPPPGQAPQQDYSAYWAAQHQQAHPTAPQAYGAQWSQSQPPRAPPADQNHLYANYGYGPHWQRQQQQQQQHAAAAAAAAQYQPPPPPPQPAYNPYQPTAGYGQPYAPPPPHVVPPPPAQAYAQPPQQIAGPSQPPQYYPQPPSGPASQQSRLHHSPPQALPPAKRQRFDGPGQQRQPQFQNQSSGGGHNNRGGGGGNMGGGGGGRNNNGSMRGMGGNRGGGRAGGGSQNRGGMANKGGRGGSFIGGSGRGGGPANALRGQGSRNNLNSNNRRTGGSFNNGMGGGSFRGRQHGGKGLSGASFGSRHGPMNSSHGNLGGKKDENRRTLTDFKLVSLEIPELNWTWGGPPLEPAAPAAEKAGDSAGGASSSDVKKEPDDGEETIPAAGIADGDANSSKPDKGEDNASSASVSSGTKPLAKQDSLLGKSNENAPPSRMRIYFHTPVSADDSHPIANSDARTSDSRKGKRKKVDDDTDSIEDDRDPPPPPQPSDDRSSVAASIAPSGTSEGDWLMAAIVDDASRSGHDDENDEEDVSHSLEYPEDHEGDGSVEEAQVKTEEEDETQLTVPDLSASGLDTDERPSENDSSAQKGEHATGDSANGASASESSTQQSIVASSSGTTEATLIEQPQNSSPKPDQKNVDEETQDDDDGHSVKTEPASPPPGQPADLPPVPVYGPVLPEHKTERVPSANRLSISYAGGSRRLVIDSEVVDNMKIFRQEGRIEVQLTLSKDGDEDIKGILVENLSDLTKSYSAVHAITNVSFDVDPTLPPFSRVGSYPASVTLVVRLDTVRPLSEPKWVKSGDIQEWLKSIFGRMFWVAGEAAQGWEKKITVVDPDPPPTIWTVLDGWALNSPVGQKNERERFIKTHMTETDNILEVLLRLVRGERATPFTTGNSSLSIAELKGPLLAAFSPGSAHGSQQSHVSLAVLATFRMACDFARQAQGDQGAKEVEDKMGDIIRCLPSHLIYKSLDGIFKEWRVDKKGGR